MSQKYSRDSLGTRMKEYEHVTRTHLVRRTPVIVRLDGKAFHTYTKHIKQADPSTNAEPWSSILHQLMMATTEYLVKNVQGCVMGYTQSDEISLLLKDWQTVDTEAWFNNNIQKMCSVSASMATMTFNSCVTNLNHALAAELHNNATFDSRVFNIPTDEVCNYFIWRQMDASRNSVQMLAQHHFSHKEIQGLNNSMIQDKLMLERNVNWNDVDVWKKRGAVVQRDIEGNVTIDKNIPIFTEQREYINNHLRTF